MADHGQHYTTWEDEQMVGVLCSRRPDGPDKDIDGFSLSVEDGAKPCPHCGATLRLRWDVRVEVSDG